MKTKEEEEENEKICCFSSSFNTALFGHMFTKNSTHSFLVHGYSSWSTFCLHLVRGPHAL